MCVIRTQFIVFKILEQNNNKFVNINASKLYIHLNWVFYNINPMWFIKMKSFYPAIFYLKNITEVEIVYYFMTIHTLTFSSVNDPVKKIKSCTFFDICKFKLNLECNNYFWEILQYILDRNLHIQEYHTTT